MQCYNCEKNIDSPWMVLNNIFEGDEETPMNKHVCGYSCYKRLSESDTLPNPLWSHVSNKSDFEGFVRPVTRGKINKFEFLSYEEVRKLDDITKEAYQRKLNDKIYLDPDSTMIHAEIMEEDRRTAFLEESEHDSDTPYDDY
jgi:hypothetical protein